MIKCNFCIGNFDNEFMYKLYTKAKNGNTITTKHINISEMDFEAIKKYNEDLGIYYLETSNRNYYFYNDLDLVEEYGFNTNNL